MRIGFVVGQFPQLSETFVIGQMPGLLRRGFEVDVVCNGITDNDFPDRHQEPLATLLARTRDWWGAAACQSALNFDPHWTAPLGVDKDRAADLPVCRMC
ncbi:hypothetical protein [Sinorhizobium prairiense]|uniref:hypothetical protein n=1 Tax=unclassified Sinorhizobium TaxID=2613772 RepID=UPI0023D844D2|nr:MULTISPECIES: hypothetical protein [unclassified Sinorhizobium]WEJ08657.1 hypothetical protein N0Q90_00685 [Sinorhizobium sp. M103]WEJ13841.1 hypothetical protein N0Q91_02005 [Sinorhizobium sp. K101]WEJ35747.1 hypothetical protein N0R80_02005 [Sinorhizobium sp. C101]